MSKYTKYLEMARMAGWERHLSRLYGRERQYDMHSSAATYTLKRSARIKSKRMRQRKERG